MEDEVVFLRGLLEDGKAAETGDFKFFSGKLEGKPAALLRCGIGKVNAAVGCALLINTYKPDFVINTGSAGGIGNFGGEAMRIGDVIISSGLVYHDADVTAFNYAPGQIPGQPPVFPVDEALIARAERAVNELKAEQALPANMNYCRGLIGSGDVFMHEAESIAKVRRLFPEIQAVEMESAAIAHCCRLFSVPALIIRSLSDIAGTESPVSFNEFLPVAAKHSAEIVRRIIRNS
jgi:adenosylhomocysteine nucleosidase